MSLSTAARVISNQWHVQPPFSANATCLSSVRPKQPLKIPVGLRFPRYQNHQKAWNRTRSEILKSWTPKRNWAVSGSVIVQANPIRSVATHIEPRDATNETSPLFNSSGYHCMTCNYTSKMPIFICNSCHALDPKGGLTESNTPAPPCSTHHSAGEALAKEKTNVYSKTKKCPHHDALPCDICDPVVSNACLSPAEKLKAKSMGRTCDYFEFFACPHKFNMDDAQLKQLTNRYRELQKALHPDVHSAKKDTTAEDLLDVQQQSAALADVYRTLRNPYQRAIYLLHLHGIDIERLSESQYNNMLGATENKNDRPNLEQLKAQEQSMLFHVMEVRETLEEAIDTSEIHDIITSASAQINECLRAMELAFEKRDLFDARHRTVLLNYLTKIQQEAEAKLELLEKTS